MKGSIIVYDPRELAWIEAHRDLPRRDLHAQFVARWGRSDVSVTHLKALCTRKGWRTGRTGRFAAGQVPANKGKPMPYHPNSAATRFQAGARSGRAAALHKPIGTERLSKEGYLERKVHDGLPMQSRWRAVHLLRWEQIHGPVPAGHALKCLDGDKANTDPTNWRCIPRAMLPRLNGHYGRGYDSAPADLRPLIMATTELEHRARTAKSDRKARGD